MHELLIPPINPLLAMLRTRDPAYHPAVALHDIATSTDDERLSYDCHKTLLRYIEPELKSVSIELKPQQDKLVRVSLFSDDTDFIEVIEPRKDIAYIEQSYDRF